MSLLNISNEVIDLSKGAETFLTKFYNTEEPLPSDDEFLSMIAAEYASGNLKPNDVPNLYMRLVSENIYSSFLSFYYSDEFANKLADIYIKEIQQEDKKVTLAVKNVLNAIDENVFIDIVDDCYEPIINSVATNYKINIKDRAGEVITDMSFQSSSCDDISDALIKIADNKCYLINKIDNEYKRLVSLDKTTENTQETHSAHTL